MPSLYRVLANAEHVDEIKQQIAGSLDDAAGKFLRHELGPIRDMRTAVAEENVRMDNDSRGTTIMTSSWPELLIYTVLLFGTEYLDSMGWMYLQRAELLASQQLLGHAADLSTS